MLKKNHIPLLGAALLLLISLCVGIVSCGRSSSEESVDPGTVAGTVGKEKLTYTLILKSEGGMPLEDVGVYFYTDSTRTELVWFAKTDEKGEVSFTDLASDLYVAVLDKVPEGYAVEEYYPLTGQSTEIILKTDMSEGDLSNVRYNLGDVMQNFSVTATDGTVYVLSELLEKTDAIVLNFWYLQCVPCRQEFPYLQEAYEKYSDKIEVIALNPINDDDAAIAAFREELGLTFPMAHCDPNWEKAMQLTAYPTTVIIDRYGCIALIHKGSVTEAKVFEDAFAFFTADDYEQTVVEDIMDLEIKEQGSDSENPIEIGGKTSFEVTVRPGQLVYYHLYRLDGMYLNISNEHAYVVYNGNTYYPNNGRIGFTVTCPDTFTPAQMAFGNSGTETITFTVTLSAPPGTFNNPHTLKLGEFTTQVAAGNDQGVYYLYKAKKTGTLTVQCIGVSGNVKYDYTLLNQNTMAMRTLQEDGDAETASVSIPVKKGHTVMLTIGTVPDSSNTYPAATFRSLASFTEGTGEEDAANQKIDYAITVTDADRNPVSGVVMKLESAVEPENAADKVSVTLTTDAKGVASTKQKPGAYTVTLTVPAGYVAATTQFTITDANPFVSLKLDKYEVIMETYTVKVVDPEGNPVSGAMVTIGAESKLTDESGTAVFELQRGSYTALVMAEGYGAVSQAFPEGQTEMTVTLGDGSEEPDVPAENVDYTITVVDYSGNPKADVTVQLLCGGAMANAGKTGADGKVTLPAPAESYTVSLAFSGTTMYYEEKTAVLPKGTTALTIRVAPGVNGPYEMIYGTYLSYYLDVGATYVTMQPQIDNYFIFEPKVEGVYRFSTSDPEARLSYWGGNLAFIFDGTASTDYDPVTNSFTQNVKKKNLGCVIILGITGAPDCIVEVTRVSDPILDETDIEPEIYEALTPPRAFTISKAQGNKLTYVDLTGNTSDYQIVMGSDGYYHLNSATGPLLYVNLGPNARYISMYNMLGYTGFGGTSLMCSFYDENGSVVRRVDYTACMCAYVESIDANYGVYPLTEDLVTMIKNGGGYKGWWNPNSANCIFLDEDKVLDPTINLELGWMFAVCYVP